MPFKGKPTREKRIQMLHDLANDGGLLHSNGQLRTERYGDTGKGCQKPAVQQKTTDDALPVTQPTAFKHCRTKVIIK